ncbi:hypothetical protein GCM10022221_41840 [Actinocorallia aurea]
MDDRTLLDLLADDAPGPSASLADAVLGEVRRVRRRRRVTVAVSSVVAACAAAVLPLLWVQQSSELHTASAARPDAASHEKPASIAPDAPLDDGRNGDGRNGDGLNGGGLNNEVAKDAGSLAEDIAPAYAAALTALPRTEASGPLTVFDAFCADRESCGRERLPQAFKTALAALVPSLAFTRDETDRAAVRLGAAVPDGERLLVFVNGEPVGVRPAADGTWTVG